MAFTNRTRKRRIPDWWDQSRYSFVEYRDPTHNNGSTPTILRNLSGNASLYTEPRGQTVTSDVNHTFRESQTFQDLDKSWRGDIGGPFSSVKSWVQIDNYRNQHFDFTGLNSGTWDRSVYNGPILSAHPSGVVATSFPSVTNLTPLGTTAISRCKPTNNIADLGASVAEIFRDGLPALLGATLWKDRTRAAKAAGGEYLNSEFGWKPLISDIRSGCYSIANAHRLMSNYERNAGKMVRRRYEFPVENTVTVEPQSLSDPGLTFNGGTSLNSWFDTTKPSPPRFKTTWSYKRTWFSGAFTYHLPVGYGSRSWIAERAKEAGYLLGIELTPNVVWNAAPWTWAVDWFSNAGDVVTNLSDWATDGLVLKYGYIMEHRILKVTYSHVGPSRLRPYGSYWPSPVSFFYESKRREKATPFGFGLSWNGMTPRQLAIAAALGITRVF